MFSLEIPMRVECTLIRKTYIYWFIDSFAIISCRIGIISNLEKSRRVCFYIPLIVIAFNIAAVSSVLTNKIGAPSLARFPTRTWRQSLQQGATVMETN